MSVRCPSVTLSVTLHETGHETGAAGIRGAAADRKLAVALGPDLQNTLEKT